MKVKLSLENVVYAKLTLNDNADPTFGTVKSWPGAVSLLLDQQGESVEFWADGLIYYMATGNSGYSGDLESALVPDDFKITHLQEYVDTAGNIVEDADKEGEPFALGFRIIGDKDNRPTWMYYCTASRPAVGSSTRTGTPEVKTESLTITSRPLKFPSISRKLIKITPQGTATAAAKEAFLDSVVAPLAPATQGGGT